MLRYQNAKAQVKVNNEGSMQWEPTAAGPLATDRPGLSYRRMGDQISYCRMGEVSAVDSGSCIIETCVWSSHNF
mgnify:CR=1 FL=1